MAPAAARRAKPVQRSSCQDLPGNPDACRPRRGVVGPSYGSFASGQARKLIPSAGPPLPTEPAAQPLAALPPYGCGVPLAGTSLGFGGGPSYRKRQPMGRAAMPARFFPANHSPPPPWAPGSGPAGPGGFPTAFDTKSGAPAAQAPPGAPPAGGWRAEVVAPHVVGTSYGSLASPQAAKLVPSTVPPLPTTTTPLGRRGGHIGRADGIRPYGPGSCHTAPAGGAPGMPRPTCRRRWRRPFGSCGSPPFWGRRRTRRPESRAAPARR